MAAPEGGSERCRGMVDLTTFAAEPVVSVRHRCECMAAIMPPRVWRLLPRRCRTDTTGSAANVVKSTIPRHRSLPPSGAAMNPLATKTVEQSIRDTEEPDHQLKKSLGPLDLTVFGVGVIIGTGIFVLTGKAAGVQAGPAVAFSFIFAAIACGLAALCYAEFASTVPVAGSAYTFSYASLGEIFAWIIGWDLILELALGASTVAVGWSTYFADVMKSAGITIPKSLYGENHNLVAAAIVLLLTAVICLGIKVSSQINLVVVTIKVAIVLLVIIAGAFYIKTANWSPFIPPSGSKAAGGASLTPSLLQDMGFSPGAFGITGIFTAAALVFFAFIGFDIVATAAAVKMPVMPKAPG